MLDIETLNFLPSFLLLCNRVRLARRYGGCVPLCPDNCDQKHWIDSLPLPEPSSWAEVASRSGFISISLKVSRGMEHLRGLLVTSLFGEMSIQTFGSLFVQIALL